MNNILMDSMPRNQTLIVVEGKREKENILKILFKCFPEIPISIESVHVYENNVYDLYHEIEEEYGEGWFEDDLEINIPMLICRKFDIRPPLERNNFTNIILMFDYEHHDTFYSDEKIMKLQKHFRSADNDGISFWEDLRSYFDVIARDNIVKANTLQEGENEAEESIKEMYYKLDWAEILEKQNNLSLDNVNGIIMVLCTCITFLGEYKFFWK